jgi:hypothetical protein
VEVDTWDKIVQLAWHLGPQESSDVIPAALENCAVALCKCYTPSYSLLACCDFRPIH